MMIDISLVLSEGKVFNRIDIKQDQRLTLNEHAIVEFQVRTNVPSDIESPVLSIGDVPLELIILDETDGIFTYTSKVSQEFHKNQCFLNFFGESYISVELCTHNLVTTFVCDIEVRKANAFLTREMLDYLATRVDDVMKLCFSRTRAGVSLEKNGGDSPFTKLSLISLFIEQVNVDISLFNRHHSTTWITDTKVKEQATSLGPDSIHYVMNNVDSLTKTISENANIRSNHSYYYLAHLPSEELIESTDTEENRQIHFALYSIKRFLNDFVTELSVETTVVHARDAEYEYLQFDDVLKNFRISIFKRKIEEIQGLIKSVDYISNMFNKIIPARLKVTTTPKLTHYIKKTPHYFRLFEIIHNWFIAPPPTLDGSQLLVGVKNLSKLYEYTSLLLLNDIVIDELGVELQNSTYMDYTLQGDVIERARPEFEINNDYFYSNGDLNIKILYEPLIYAYTANSKPNSLVNISGKKNTKYPEYPHAYSPDFIVEIMKTAWPEPIYMILDSKFTNRKNVAKEYLPSLIQKYFFGIHRTKENLSLGMSPIKAVIALFPHNTYGVKVNNISQEHCLTGSNPVLPHVSGQLFTPLKTTLIRKSISNLIKIIDSNTLAK